MPIDSAKIELSTYRALGEKKIGLAAAVAQLTASEGFLILKAILYNFEQDVKNKRCQTFEEYNAKMEALEIVRGLFAELDAIVADGEAQNQINKVIEAENSTPSILSLDGEGTEDGQLADS